MNRLSAPVRERRLDWRLGLRPVGVLLGVVASGLLVTTVLAQPVADPMPEVRPPVEGRLVTGVLHQVIDGDSVELFVNGRIVQYELAGADAPDVVDDERKSIRGSKEAKDYLVSLLVGEQLAVMADARRPTDAMGRARGYLYRMPDGLFVNLEMVRLGLAKHSRDPSAFNDAAMLWAQGRARDARKGVWSPVPKVIVVAEAVEAPAEPAVVETEPEKEPAAVVEPAAESSVVYVTKSGSKYHTKECRHVGDSSIVKTRDEVDGSYEACKVCKPDKSSDD